MRFLSCLLCIQLCAFAAHAAEKIYEYKWNPPPPRAEIPAEHADEDAVIIYDSTRFNLSDKSYFTQYQRIRIQTTRGLDNHTRIVIPAFAGSTIKTLDARTIKKNGQVVDLSNTDIKKLDLAEQSLESTMKFVIFSVPGVEVGDEIETVFIIEKSAPSYQYFLHGELPKLETVYKLIVPHQYIMDLLLYNEMPQPDFEKDTEDKIYTWHLKNLPGTGSQSCSIRSLKLPFIIQVISGITTMWFTTPAIKWEDIPGGFIEAAKTDYNRSGKYYDAIEKLEAQVSAGIDPTDTVARIAAVHRYMNENMKVVDATAENSYLAISKMIEQKEITFQKLDYFYINLFSKLRIPYHIVFARERYRGPIDTKVVSLQQIDHILFAIEVGGALHYIVSRSEDETYELNELPVSIQSTNAIVIHARNKTAGQILLSKAKEEDNFRMHKVKANIDYAANTIKLDVQEIMNGAFSTQFRQHYLHVENKKELDEYFKNVMKQRCPAAEVDTVYITKGDGYPQTFRLNYTLVLKDKIAQLEDNLYSLSLEDLFWYNYEEIDVKRRTMDYYPLCTTSEDFKYYLMFNQKVELVNGENLKLEVAYPEIGDYRFSAKPVKEDIVLIESACRKGGSKIPVENIGKLAELNDAVKRADDEPLLFRVVK